LDVDEILLCATTGDEINGIAANLPLPTTTTSQNGSPHLCHHSRRHGEDGAGSTRRVHVYQGQQAQEGAGYAYPANQSVPRKELSSGVGLQQQPGGGGQQPGPLVQPGQVQQYQTHVFAPIVTGELMKKPKYSVSGSSIGGEGSVGVLAGAGGGAGAGGKSLFVLFRVSLSSFFFFFFHFACSYNSMSRNGHRLSVLLHLAFLPNTFFAIFRSSFQGDGYRERPISYAILLLVSCCFLLFSFVYHSPLTLHLGRFSPFQFPFLFDSVF
jgi:hypothetical protein